MLVFIEQKHIDAGQRSPRGGMRGATCPLAQAIRDMYNLPLGSVYVGPMTVYINWTGGAADVRDDDGHTKLFNSHEAENFVARADNESRADNDSGTRYLKPTVVNLKQYPAHCPVEDMP